MPAESVTLAAVALVLFHTPTSTIIRLPVVMLVPGVTERLAKEAPCAVACWTKLGAGGGVADGVTAFDVPGGPVPIELVAVTWKV